MMVLDARDSQRLESYRRITKRTKLSLTAWRFPAILSCSGRW
ncbi:unnamed protein product [Brassica oleracea var. botrytis]